MSSSDSEDFEGFESAEEDVAVSDLDEDELERILAQDSPSETNETDEPSDRPKGKPTQTTNASEKDSHVTDNTLVSDSCKGKDIDALNESRDDRLNNVRVAKEETSNLSHHSNQFKNTELSPDKVVNRESPLTTLDREVLDNRPLVDRIHERDENSSIVNTCNGWDFEDDNVDLLVSPEDENVCSITSGSSGKTQSSSLNLKESNEGDIPFGTASSRVGNSQSGWDFEDDFELPDSPEKKNHPSNEDQSVIRQSETSESNEGWPSWGNWGVTKLISSAAEGVTATSWSHVTSGLSSMLENTLGAPDPQVLATQLSPSQDKQLHNPDNPNEEETSPELADLFGIGSILGGVKNLGNKVIDGGLGTLETLGKKTMQVLQEGDPGLKKKRALLFQTEKVILSQVLRDAKEKAEASEEEHSKFSRKAQYETLFDDFHGLVHLEALEMISRQCEIKMQSSSSNNLKVSPKEFSETVNVVKSLYEQNCLQENEEKELVSENLKTFLDNCLEDLSLNVNLKNLLEVDESIQSRLQQSFTDGTEIHTHAISDLAQFTACTIELFHRIAELFIVKDHSNVEKDFKALSRIASVSKSKIGAISESYSGKLMQLHDKSNNPLITNIFLEASNSSSYLDNAFELFSPIIQLKAF